MSNNGASGRVKRGRVTPIQHLIAAMDRCAFARGEAQWTNGYRAAKGGAEEERLYAKEVRQWQDVGRAERQFKRIAQRVLRDTRASATLFEGGG